MVKFAHLADCHLGSWRQPELRQLNLESFKKAIELCILERVEFVLIAGDLFDSAYPPVEILEETFSELKKLKDENIPCYIIAGSHDYSASGKTFLSVLEKAGFCQNLYRPEESNSKIFLNPLIYKNVALYGYPGKKSGLEIEELRKIKLQETPGLFRVFALHTTIKNAVGNIPMQYIKETELPEADYYALGHLHLDYEQNKFVYGGPTFPNNFQELEELGHGSFYLVETEPFKLVKKEISLKETEPVKIEIDNALTATDKILSELNKKDLRDKIVLLRLSGKLAQGKTSDINFKEIENFAKQQGAYILLRNTSKLVTEEAEIEFEIENMDELEEEIIKKYLEKDSSKFNKMIFQLINSLSIEKQEGETAANFQARLFSELNKILKLK